MRSEYIIGWPELQLPTPLPVSLESGGGSASSSNCSTGVGSEEPEAFDLAEREVGRLVLGVFFSSSESQS